MNLTSLFMAGSIRTAEVLSSGIFIEDAKCFPVINTHKTLAEIDYYMQDCIRYIATEKRNNGRFKYRYADMKKLGYRSLVHEYYLLKRHRIDDNETSV